MWQMFKICFVRIDFDKINLIKQQKFVNNLDELKPVLQVNKN